jgi:rod shape-determining protein MreC
MNQKKLVLVLAGALFLAVFFGVLYGIQRVVAWDAPNRALASLYESSSRARMAVSAAITAWRGETQLQSLEKENERLRSELAGARDLEEENEFLRRISDLPARRDRLTVVAEIFAYGIGGQEFSMVLNRGSRDQITPGAAVVTESGVLVGIVSSVHGRVSRVAVIGDTSVQVTGRIVDTEVGGLVRVDGSGTLVLDMIAKGEDVTEGVTVVTSGLDHVPAGLIIGTVRSVDADSTALFQIVRLNPAHKEGPVTRVLVLNP